jgi:hypothetical protein
MGLKNEGIIKMLYIRTRYLLQKGILAGLVVMISCQDIRNQDAPSSVIPTKVALADQTEPGHRNFDASTQETAISNPSSKVVQDKRPCSVNPQKQEKKTKPPPNPKLRCRKNADCVLLPPRPCSCPPCGDVLREAMNKKAAKELLSRWARRRCRKPVCKKCEGRYIGAKAMCIKGQCQTR